MDYFGDYSLKESNLYKRGIIRTGTIIALTANCGLPISNIGRSVIIDYYWSVIGARLFGNSNTTDFSVLANKKVTDSIALFVDINDKTRSCIVP